ncbi:MAG: TetR/AcrR family transcriptional regulator, partial [Deltaproteobacteria bacterium]|nr:TetR/AcrR family transcriptional regulator [Deltaproteobacteria bacterium]
MNKTKSDLNPASKIRLEKAVKQLFASTHFHRVNMTAVAREAGVGLDTIYKYYTNKEQLVLVLFNEWVLRLREQVVDQLTAMADPKEKLRKIAWLMLRYFEENPEVGQIYFMTTPHSLWHSPGYYRNKVEKMWAYYYEVIREGQEKGLIEFET